MSERRRSVEPSPGRQEQGEDRLAVPFLLVGLTLAAGTAHCTYSTELITVATFFSADQRDLWVSASRAAAGGLGVKGEGWAAIVIDQQVAAELATALGGSLS